MTISGNGGYPAAPIDDPITRPQPVVGSADSGSPSGKPAQVGQTARDQGTQIASSAADELGNVAHESATQARNLLHETQSQLQEQAGTQKDRATSRLHTLADELRTMSQARSDTVQPGLANDLAGHAADKVHGVATWLEAREPASLLDEVRALARRKPGTFLLGAAAAGLLAGRLTRGSVDAKRESGYDSESTSSDVLPATQPAMFPTDPALRADALSPDVVVDETRVVPQPDLSAHDPKHSYAGGERR